MQCSIPNLISALRLVISPLMLLLAWHGYATGFLALMILSFVSDVLDGYLARRWGQTSELGARLDSIGDFVIYLTLPLAGWWLWPDLMLQEAVAVLAVVASCLLPPAVALLKFRQLTSYHTWLVKLAALTVGCSLFLLFVGGPAWPFRLAAVIAVCSALEEIGITLVLQDYRSNVRSIYQAWQQRSNAMH